mmetsp:Transcript_4723/g.14413  ORF Transcript_4723/g.14413 Transcript_4723/m.14413 type:complete len:724 (-) Transcript_4723:6168-8339(-)
MLWRGSVVEDLLLEVSSARGAIHHDGTIGDVHEQRGDSRRQFLRRAGRGVVEAGERRGKAVGAQPHVRDGYHTPAASALHSPAQACADDAAQNGVEHAAPHAAARAVRLRVRHNAHHLAPREVVPVAAPAQQRHRVVEEGIDDRALLATRPRQLGRGRSIQGVTLTRRHLSNDSQRFRNGVRGRARCLKALRCRRRVECLWRVAGIEEVRARGQGVAQQAQEPLPRVEVGVLQRRHHVTAYRHGLRGVPRVRHAAPRQSLHARESVTHNLPGNHDLTVGVPGAQGHGLERDRVDCHAVNEAHATLGGVDEHGVEHADRAEHARLRVQHGATHGRGSAAAGVPGEAQDRHAQPTEDVHHVPVFRQRPPILGAQEVGEGRCPRRIRLAVVADRVDHVGQRPGAKRLERKLRPGGPPPRHHIVPHLPLHRHHLPGLRVHESAAGLRRGRARPMRGHRKARGRLHLHGLVELQAHPHRQRAASSQLHLRVLRLTGNVRQVRARALDCCGVEGRVRLHVGRELGERANRVLPPRQQLQQAFAVLLPLVRAGLGAQHVVPRDERRPVHAQLLPADELHFNVLPATAPALHLLARSHLHVFNLAARDALLHLVVEVADVLLLLGELLRDEVGLILQLVEERLHVEPLEIDVAAGLVIKLVQPLAAQALAGSPARVFLLRHDVQVLLALALLLAIRPLARIQRAPTCHASAVEAGQGDHQQCAHARHQRGE